MAGLGTRAHQCKRGPLVAYRPESCQPVAGLGFPVSPSTYQPPSHVLAGMSSSPPSGCMWSLGRLGPGVRLSQRLHRQLTRKVNDRLAGPSRPGRRAHGRDRPARFCPFRETWPLACCHSRRRHVQGKVAGTGVFAFGVGTMTVRDRRGRGGPGAGQDKWGAAADTLISGASPCKCFPS